MNMYRFAISIRAETWKRLIKHSSDTMDEIITKLLDEHEEKMTSCANLKNLLQEVRHSGVVFEDEQVGYMEIRIGRDTWAEIKKVLKAFDDKEASYFYNNALGLPYDTLKD